MNIEHDGQVGAADELDCDAAIQQLQDYLKRELTPELERKVKAHLERCHHCFGELRYGERFLDLVRTPAGGVRCPDSLRARIADALRGEAAGR